MVADDTPNEEDIKLEVLYDCVKDLDVSIEDPKSRCNG